jgi:hypothetical protein
MQSTILDENIDLLFPYIDIKDIVNLMFSWHSVANSITEYYYSRNNWSNDNPEPLVCRINRVIKRYKCRYCPMLSFNELCPDHWCNSCGDYRPIFICTKEALMRKHKYICQKCSKCESCPQGAPRLRYVNTSEYGTNCTLLAMVICDRCIKSCAQCGSPNNYLCIGNDGSRLSRCANCINMKDFIDGKIMLVKNFTID